MEWLIHLSVMTALTWVFWSILDVIENTGEYMSNWNLFNLIMFAISAVIYAPIKSTQILLSLKPKSDLEKEIADKKLEIKRLKKHKADMEKLKELEHEHEGLFELTRTPSESHFLKGEKYCAICDEWYQGERCPRHVKNQYAVDPSKFMSGQSTKKTGEEHTKAINPLSGTCPRCNSERIERTISGNSLEVTTTIHCNDCEFEASWEEVKADE